MIASCKAHPNPECVSVKGRYTTNSWSAIFVAENLTLRQASMFTTSTLSGDFIVDGNATDRSAENNHYKTMIVTKSVGNVANIEYSSFSFRPIFRIPG